MMASLVNRTRGRGWVGLALQHFKGFADRLGKVSSSRRAAPQMTCGYASNLDAPVFRGVQNACAHFNLNCAVDVTESRNTIKVQK
jgi:hypothetical protein